MERATDEIWQLEAVPPNLAKQLPEWQRIIAQLEMTRADVDQTTVPRPQGAVREWLGRWFLFLQFSALALFALNAVWQDGRFSDWVSFWIFAGVAAVLSLVALPGTSPLGPMPAIQRPEYLFKLREAAALGDDTVAPPSPHQPAVLADSLSSVHEMTLRPLYRADVVFSYGFILAFFAGMELLVGLEQLLTSHAISWWSSISLLFGGGPICLGVVFAAQFVLRRRGFSVVADEDGLHWRERGRRQRIPWQDIRSLCVLYLPDVFMAPYVRPPRRIYLLDTGSTMLTWVPSPSGRHKRRGVDPSWLLCRLVVTRTGLLLRDIGPGFTCITEERAHVDSRAAWREIRAAIVGDATTLRAQRLRIARVFVPFGLSVLLIMSLIGAGVAVLKWQPRAYADRLAAARASTLLLRDPLAKDTGLWPVTSDGHQSFTNGAYTLQAPDENASFGWAPRIFGDVVLDITMRYVADYDLQTAGIILRADDATKSMLVFAVIPMARGGSIGCR